MIKTKQEIADLICCMIEGHATKGEMARVIDYSTAAMDCQKSYERMAIAELEKKYSLHNKNKDEKVMTYNDIYNEFCNKFPDAEVEDYRPADPLYIPQLAAPIPYSIIVWLKDGSKIIYIAKEEEK